MAHICISHNRLNMIVHTHCFYSVMHIFSHTVACNLHKIKEKKNNDCKWTNYLLMENVCVWIDRKKTHQVMNKVLTIERWTKISHFPCYWIGFLIFPINLANGSFNSVSDENQISLLQVWDRIYVNTIQVCDIFKFFWVSVKHHSSHVNVRSNQVNSVLGEIRAN